MARLSDVAARAGVGLATASRVLNGNPRVAPETRKRVLAAAQELRFRPSGSARSLATGSTRTVGLVLPDIANPFFPVLSRGLDDAAHADGFAVIVTNTDNLPDREAACVSLLRDRSVDGIVIVSSGMPQALPDLVGSVPALLVDRRVPGWSADSVSSDNVMGGRQAAEHLIAKGHRRIAHLGGPSVVDSASDRRAGYLATLAEAGLDAPAEWISAGPFTFESGYERMLQWIDNGLDATAVFAANDLIAVGALQACQDRGWPVPERVALVGYDDILFARLVRPRLTTVAQPAFRMGVLAWELLARRIKEPDKPTEHLVLPTKLIEREST